VALARRIAMEKAVICALVLAVLSGTPAALAQPPEAAQKAPAEGELATFLNFDARDVPTRLEVIQHAIYEVNQRLIVESFVREHGSRVRLTRVDYPNHDRELTPAYVFEPVHLDPGRKLPALVVVHGGFHYSFTEDIFEFVARAVEEGYIAVFPEYRGSRGYGAEHYDAADYGGREVDDVLAAADYVRTRRGVDPSRVGIAGRSHGGMIALLAIQRAPKAFRAAVDVVGLTDFVAYMAYKPDYRREEVMRQPRFGGKLPSQNLPAYMDVSPLNHVDDIQTPLLIHSTTGDKTAPVQLHAERLIDALKARGKTFEYKIYDRAPGGHVYSRGDSPESRDSADRIFAFLAKHLKG
jgi:dipeptidyl aminopeptidase/acylaminoacyl peptidase